MSLWEKSIEYQTPVKLHQLNDMNLNRTTKNIIIGTGSNSDYFDKHTSDLLNNVITAGMIPIITQATRVTATSSTLIDNIYVNYKDNMDQILTGIISSDISDHFPVFMFHGKQPKPNNIPIFIKTRLLDEKKCIKSAGVYIQ